MPTRDTIDWDMLVREHHATCLRIVRQWVPREDWADDVVQNAWLSALEHPERVPCAGMFMRWFVTVLRYQARNYRVRHQTTQSGAPIQRESVLEDVYRAVEQADGPQELHEVLELCQQMTPGRQRSIQLALAGYNCMEVGQLEQISHWSARSRLSRARHQLRGYFK